MSCIYVRFIYSFHSYVYFAFFLPKIDAKKCFSCIHDCSCILEKVKVKSLSHVQLLAIPWTVAYQAPPSMDSPGKSTGVDFHFLLHNWECYINGCSIGRMRFCHSFLLSWVHSLRWRGLTVSTSILPNIREKGAPSAPQDDLGGASHCPVTDRLGVVWIQTQWGSPWSEPGICNWPVTPCKLLFSVDMMLSPWYRLRLNQRPRLWEAPGLFLPPLRPLLRAALSQPCPCSYPPPPSMPSTPGGLWHPTPLHEPCHTQPSCPWEANSSLLSSLKQPSKHSLTPL